MTLRNISSVAAIALLVSACGDDAQTAEQSSSTTDATDTDSTDGSDVSSSDPTTNPSGSSTTAGTSSTATTSGTGDTDSGSTSGDDTSSGSTSSGETGETGETGTTDSDTGSETGMDCDPGELKCNGECINPLTDKMYCGASMDCMGANAGVVCEMDQVCNNGKCELECKPTEVLCDGTCINPETDGKYCGASGDCMGDKKGVECLEGQVCTNGVCDEDCGADEIWCAMECVNPKTNPDFCGAEEPCTGDKVGKKCKDNEVCDNGSCELDCSEDLIACDGTCVDPKTDSKYCGAKDPCDENKGSVCEKGNVCVDGKCELQCPGDLLKCGDECINPDSDPNYCGASDDCTGSNDGDKCITGEACVGGMCVDISDAGWTAPERVEDTSQHDTRPDVAIDGLGNVIAVWERGGDIFANRYESDVRSLQSRSWGDDERISNTNGGSSAPQIGVDLNGNAVVVWSQDNEIYSARYDVGDDSWLPETRLDDDTGAENASQPSLAVSRGGKALVIWLESDGTNTAIVGSAYSGSSWSGEESVLDVADTNAKGSPNVAINAAGKGMAVWSREDGDQTQVYSRRFDGSVWAAEDPIRVDSSANVDARYPQVGIAGDGEAVALWLHDADAPFLHRAKSTSGGWTNSGQLAGSNQVTDAMPRLAMSEAGHAIAIWLRNSSSSNREYVYASFRDKGSNNWDAGVAIARSSTTYAFNPQVEIDRSGNVFVTWSQSSAATGTKNVRVRRRVSNTSTWLETSDLDSSNLSASMPQVAVNPQGQGAVIWQQVVNSNSDDIYVSRYNNN